MDKALLVCVLLLVCRCALGAGGAAPAAIVLEGERPAGQRGSRGPDAKAAASGGQVLGSEFGGAPGHFAEYVFEAPREIAPARITIRYARALAGARHFRVLLDGAPVGEITYRPTGGWGGAPGEFREAALTVPKLAAGTHRLRLTVAEPPALPGQDPRLPAVPVLERVGNRSDKNSVGHGRNVALYTGTPSRFFYATHELGDVFSAAGGGTIRWYPDHVLVTPQPERAAPGNVNLDRIVITEGDRTEATTDTAAPPPPRDGVVERRQVCVTRDDVVVSRIHLFNPGGAPRTHRVEVAGDCRASFDWRGKPGGEKVSRREGGDTVVLVDKNVFPNVLPDGLAIVVGGTTPPAAVDTSIPGTYRMTYEVEVPPGATRTLTLACAIGRDVPGARKSLSRVLKQPDPLLANRKDWQAFYERQVPAFECSDASLTELYAFRWFLLKFSTAGGDLGLFKYPVVMEGRQAFQTYCCYSAPFMAFDLNWQTDPQAGFGHLANMPLVAYEDGRFPWYTSPRTNDVPLDHRSKTGMSLMPWTAWRFYQIHGRKDLLRDLYPGMKKNVDWWIRDRDGDGNGLFSIDHQLETGMDDLFRRWAGGKAPERYEAVDATSYAVLNLQAVANMAREVGETADVARYQAYAAKAERALHAVAWDGQLQRFRDRNPDTGELADYNSITIFYPLFAGAVQVRHLPVVRRYLLSPAEYWTAHPLPALSQADRDFDPVKGYWRGPSWPAANTHVVEGFADAAKRLDRSLLPQAAELFKRAAANHLQPRADFYERYDPLSGRPLSDFRDYMHSWWIDLVIRHVAGLTPQDDGSLVIDPLPAGLEHFALRGAPHRGRRIDVLWNDPKAGKGLTVRRDGKVLRRAPDFVPGRDTLTLPAEPAAGK